MMHHAMPMVKLVIMPMSSATGSNLNRLATQLSCNHTGLRKIFHAVSLGMQEPIAIMVLLIDLGLLFVLM